MVEKFSVERKGKLLKVIKAGGVQSALTKVKKEFPKDNIVVGFKLTSKTRTKTKKATKKRKKSQQAQTQPRFFDIKF